MHLFSADSLRDYLLKESHKIFNEINKTYQGCNKANKGDIKLFSRGCLKGANMQYNIYKSGYEIMFDANYEIV